MEQLFQLISLSENVQFTKNEQKWFNGHANFPLFIYAIEFNYKFAKIKLEYELRQNEFTKPFGYDQGAFADRHIYSSICSFSSSDKLPTFQIAERNFIKKLLVSRPAEYYVVKTFDAKLKKRLHSNKILNRIFQISENSAEFSPLLESDYQDGQYEIKIMFNTQIVDLEILTLVKDFFKEVVDLFEESNDG